MSCGGCHPMFQRAQRYYDTYQVPVSEIPTCTGCLHDQSNQLAHMDPGGCLYEEEVASINLRGIPYVEELFIESIATEIRADQNAALEAASQRLLAMDFGDLEEPDAEESEKPKVDISKPLVPPLFALPCGFAFPECAVCYEPIEMVNVAVTTCGHAFHASCAFRALDRSDCCPMCRHLLVDDGCEADEQSEAGEDEDDEDDEDEESENVEEEDGAKVSLEQLTGKLANMGYTMADIIKSLLPSLNSETNEAKYTKEFSNKLHYDIEDIMDGTINLADRDARTYAEVVAADRPLV